MAHDVITRELGFETTVLQRSAFRRELQQVCVELGLGCEIDESRRVTHSRFHVLVRGTAEGIKALEDYADVSGWTSWSDDRAGET